jgi:hypothetical protein
MKSILLSLLICLAACASLDRSDNPQAAPPADAESSPVGSDASMPPPPPPPPIDASIPEDAPEQPDAGCHTGCTCDSDCSHGEYCVSGTCERKCGCMEDCPSGYSCDRGYCELK